MVSAATAVLDQVMGVMSTPWRHSEESCENFGMTAPPSLPIDATSPAAEDSPTEVLLRGLRIHEKTGDMTPAAALAFSHHEGFEAADGSTTPVMIATPRVMGNDGEKLGGSGCRGPAKRITRIHSIPSESYHVYQAPMFHQLVLKPFYQRHPISNVVMGLVMGTSTYARSSIEEGVGRLIRASHLHTGGFILIPNPKFHEDPSIVAALAKNLRRGRGFGSASFRFVVWWIPESLWHFVEEWVGRTLSEGRQEDYGDNCGTRGLSGHSGGYEFVDINSFEDLHTPMGSPGDFRFSDVPKPCEEEYLHTYRDLDSPTHVEMLRHLLAECHQFLTDLLGENFVSGAKLSMGFHYPVRTQYSTLHMQIRVNSGDVVSRDGRGVAARHVLAVLERDPMHYARDNMPLRYEVTENIKMNLLAAAELDSTGDSTVGGSQGEEANQGDRRPGYLFNCIGLGQYELLLGGTECNEGGEYGLDGSSINVGEDASWQHPPAKEGPEDAFDKPMSTIAEGSVGSLEESLREAER